MTWNDPSSMYDESNISGLLPEEDLLGPPTDLDETESDLDSLPKNMRDPVQDFADWESQHKFGRIGDRLRGRRRNDYSTGPPRTTIRNHNPRPPTTTAAPSTTQPTALQMPQFRPTAPSNSMPPVPSTTQPEEDEARGVSLFPIDSNPQNTAPYDTWRQPHPYVQPVSTTVPNASNYPGPDPAYVPGSPPPRRPSRADSGIGLVDADDPEQRTALADPGIGFVDADDPEQRTTLAASGITVSRNPISEVTTVNFDLERIESGKGARGAMKANGMDIVWRIDFDDSKTRGAKELNIRDRTKLPDYNSHGQPQTHGADPWQPGPLHDNPIDYARGVYGGQVGGYGHPSQPWQMNQSDPMTAWENSRAFMQPPPKPPTFDTHPPEQIVTPASTTHSTMNRPQSDIGSAFSWAPADVEEWKKVVAETLQGATTADLQATKAASQRDPAEIDSWMRAASSKQDTEQDPSKLRDAILGQAWNPDETALDRFDWASYGLVPGDVLDLGGGQSHTLNNVDIQDIATSRMLKFHQLRDEASRRFIPDEQTFDTHRRKNRTLGQKLLGRKGRGSAMQSVDPLASNLTDLHDTQAWSSIAPQGTDSEALDWVSKNTASSYGLKSIPYGDLENTADTAARFSLVGGDPDKFDSLLSSKTDQTYADTSHNSWLQGLRPPSPNSEPRAPIYDDETQQFRDRAYDSNLRTIAQNFLGPDESQRKLARAMTDSHMMLPPSEFEGDKSSTRQARWGSLVGLKPRQKSGKEKRKRGFWPWSSSGK